MRGYFGLRARRRVFGLWNEAESLTFRTFEPWVWEDIRPILVLSLQKQDVQRTNVTVRTPLRVALAAADALAFCLVFLVADLGLVPATLSDILFRNPNHQCATRNIAARYWTVTKPHLPVFWSFGAIVVEDV